jgi:hypothetical protein
MNPPGFTSRARRGRLMPGLGVEPGDLVLANKKQFSSFSATDLANLIRVLGVDAWYWPGRHQHLRAVDRSGRVQPGPAGHRGG